MKRPPREKWIFGGVLLAVLVLVFAGTAWGQVTPPSPQEVKPEAVEEEAPPPIPPKPEVPEKPAPGAPETPGAFPAAAAPAPQTLGEVGALLGILAPYGNPSALDTLMRGWQTHKLDGFRFTPYLEYNGLYRSNIFLTASDKKSDFINVVNPGLKVEVPLGGLNRISMAYLGNYYLYTQHDDQSHYDSNVNGDLAINFRGGLSFRVGNTFRAATEERTAITGRQRDYTRDTPYFLVDYRFSDRWRVQGIYQYDILDFRLPVDRFDAYREHVGGPTLYYRFWPKTAAFLQFITTAREYPSSPTANNTSQNPYVGLFWDPTAKLTGSVKFGYTFKNYDTSIPGRNNSPQTWSLSVQTLYRYSRYTQISLTAQRSIQEDLDFGNNAYINSGVFLSIYHEWHYLMATTYFAASYSNNDYLNEVPITVSPGVTKNFLRNDNVVTLGGGIIRPVTRWLRLRLDYNYANRGTNVPGLPYNEHRVLFGAQVSY